MTELLIVVGAVLALAVLINVVSRLRDRKAPDRRRKAPGIGRPVKRFKKRLRGWHLQPKRVETNTDGGTQNVIGVDHKNWIRLYPNPGYRLNGWHRCRATHRKKLRWEGGE